MDGKLLLLLFAGLCGAGWFLSQSDLSIGAPTTGPSKPPLSLAEVVDTRHQNIRQSLVRDGYDPADPNVYVFERDGREIVGGPVAATEHGHMVFLRDIYTWYLYPAVTDEPRAIETLPVQTGCTPTPPVPGARAANIFAGPTLQAVPVYAYTETELTALAEARLARVRANGLGAAPTVSDMMVATGLGGGGTIQSVSLGSGNLSDPFRFSAMEIVVTETRSPVHLVLQSGEGRIMWNLSLAPGARISGVTLLGGTMSAISNLPEGVPVEVMDAAALADCGLVPTRRPLLSDPLLAGVVDGSVPPDAARPELERHEAAVEAWNVWFEAAFGIRDDATRIGHDVASIAALVGPVPTAPEARVGYHGFKGRTIWMTPAAGTVRGLRPTADAKMRTWIDRRAEEVAGAPLREIAGQGS